MKAARSPFRPQRTLLDKPWLLEIYCLLRANPLARLGTAERTRLFCVAIEALLAELHPWQRDYLAAWLEGLRGEALAARMGCSARTLARRLARVAQ